MVRESALPESDSDVLLYLKEVENDERSANVPADFRKSILELANNEAKLEKCVAFLEFSPKKVAEALCKQIEAVLSTFVTKDSSWEKKERKETASLLNTTFRLYQPIIDNLDRPPLLIFRRLFFFHNNIFIIQRHAECEPLVKCFLSLIVDLCEIWFLKKRSEDAYKLLSNCIVLLLSQKLTTAVFKRLNNWDSYWNYFKIEPLKERSGGMRSLFADLPKEDWESDSVDSSDVEQPLKAVLEVEKVPFLADAIMITMSKPEILASPEGKKFLTSLLSVSSDFVHLGRLAIDSIMSSDPGDRKNLQLEQFSDVLIKTWVTLHKADDIIRADLEAFIITDLMKRSLFTSPHHPKKYLGKFTLMVCSMYNRNEVTVRNMFHKNFDDMILDGVNGSNDVVKVNSLVMLGKCFPMIGPDVPKKDHTKMVKQQITFIVTNLKSVKADLRAAAAQAGGEVLVRAWNLIAIEERSEIIRQLTERLVFDGSNTAVRVTAVQAIAKLLEQPLALSLMVPILTTLKEVATDDSIQVRVEYYNLLHEAIKQGIHEHENGGNIIDSQQILAHFLERDRPYYGALVHILDKILWNINNMKNFLSNSIKLYVEQPAVASKYFQNIPKSKTADEIAKVLHCILDQVKLAVDAEKVALSGDRMPPKCLLSLKKPSEINIALEIAGTIWSATVLTLGEDRETNEGVQIKARELLHCLETKHDKIKEINLYRIACRLPFETELRNKTPVRDYFNFCLEQLRNISPANLEEGISLISFITGWGGEGHGEEVINLAKDWLEADTETMSGKRRKKVAVEDRRAHVGLQYLAMTLSDPDVSGNFVQLEKEVLDITTQSAQAFLKLLPSRFSRNFEPSDRQVDDNFFCIVPVLMSLCWAQRIRYEKDCTVLKGHFQQLLLALKGHIFEWVGLGNPTNLVYVIQHYKSTLRSGQQKKVNSDNYTTALADRIIKTFKDILAEIVDLAKTEDEDLHYQLLGYKSDAPVQLALVTPSETLPEAVKAKKAKAIRKKKRN